LAILQRIFESLEKLQRFTLLVAPIIAILGVIGAFWPATGPDTPLVYRAMPSVALIAIAGVILFLVVHRSLRKQRADEWKQLQQGSSAAVPLVQPSAVDEE